jgi:mRNA-degrading endonuclease toxin of MazEF toxin-antitoxin module
VSRSCLDRGHDLVQLAVERLGRRVGRLEAADMWAVDEALAVVMGLV